MKKILIYLSSEFSKRTVLGPVKTLETLETLITSLLPTKHKITFFGLSMILFMTKSVNNLVHKRDEEYYSLHRNLQIHP